MPAKLPVSAPKPSICIHVVGRVKGKTYIKEYNTSQDMATGKQLHRLLHVKPEIPIYSIDIQGHVAQELGAIHDAEVVCLRDGREFWAGDE